MSNPKISVIIPVYNAGSFLQRCVDSLLAQTLQDFEIILVNDGSTDNSGKLCEQYALSDSRIKVYHQPNSGVAMARQKGVDAACGCYSIHVDPDDWVEPAMLDELYSKAVECDADMVICDFMVDFSDHSYRASQKVGRCDAEDCLDRMMYGKIHGSLCNKLIRTELYAKYDIRFFEGINYCEDYLTNVQLFINGIRIAYIPTAFYHYDQVVNGNSATRRYTKATLKTQFLFFDKLREILGARQKRALSHVIAVIAFDSYYYKILSSAEFADIFGKYRNDFLKSKLKFKRRVALFLAASGLLKLAQKIV